MQTLTPAGQSVVNELSARHGFSTEAVTQMLIAVLQGNGTMAQFSHPEFGGSGQWLQGGMLMLGDMFNHNLKGRVDSLCQDIAGILRSQPGLLSTGSFQHQSQSGSGQQSQGAGMSGARSSLFVPDPNDHYWPAELGNPDATGVQNNVRYAYFAGARRLAVKTGDQVWVYDTLNHQIGGFSQQQGMGSSIVFTSQYGTVDLAMLPVVSRNGQSVSPAMRSNAPPVAPNEPTAAMTSPSEPPSPRVDTDIFSAIERLGTLKEKGILTEEEFSSKKSELLSRL